MKKIFKIQNLIFIILIMAAPLLAIPYTDNGDGTVYDGRTGLVWQKCSMGQNNDTTCSGTATTATWAIALTYCNDLNSYNAVGFASHTTWRLPNINELKSIVDRNISPNPSAINNTIFPNTLANIYWSSSTYVPSTTDAWGVAFTSGNVGYYNKTNSYYVRCVASGS
jgi:hypothetical protein